MENTKSEKILAKLMFWNWIATMASLVAGAGILIMYVRQLPPVIPLFYSRPWGQEQLTKPGLLGIPISIAVGFGIIAAMAGKIVRKEPVLGIIVTASSITIQIIIILAILRIVWLVT